MKNKTAWSVLAVDDDSDRLDEIERILENRMDGEVFELTKETSFDEGVKLIESNRFDIIFLDVHEDNGDPDPASEPNAEDQKGESLLRCLQSIRFIPVIFYTGYPKKVEHLKSTVVKVVAKGSKHEEIRQAVREILSTKLPHLIKYIEEQSRTYIWDSLSELMKLHESETNSSDISLLLARKLSNSLSQSVIKQLLDMDINKINPLEIYQYPIDITTCNPADIYKRKNDETLWMVLTPACDFEQNKVDNVLMARVMPICEHPLYIEWKDSTTRYEELPDDANKKQEQKIVSDARGKVISLVKGKISERYKFLPGTFFLPDSVVDFQDLINHPRASEDDFIAICSLDNPYREEMLHLFSKYYGRIGTPDYDNAPVWQKIEQDFKHVLATEQGT